MTIARSRSWTRVDRPPADSREFGATAKTTRRRILFIHPSDELYGADRVLVDLLKATPENLDVEVWLPQDLAHPQLSLCDYLRRNNHNVVVRHVDLPILRRADQNLVGMTALLRRSLRVLRDLRRAHPDIVYCTTSAALLLAPLARLAGVRSVVGHVQEIWGRSERSLLSLPAAACNRVIAISHAVKDDLPHWLQKRTRVVINATRAPATLVDASDRSGDLTYVVASRWNGWKGHRTLLWAWSMAGCPGHLVILGGPPPSGQAVDVPRVVRELGLSDSVTIVGEVDDPSPYLLDGDVVVVPSDAPEPFGLLVIEAFARERPVIASRAGGPLETVTEGHDGWLFPPGDSEALAAIFAGLTRRKVTEAGAHARETFNHHYTGSRYVERWRRATFD